MPEIIEKTLSKTARNEKELLSRNAFQCKLLKYCIQEGIFSLDDMEKVQIFGKHVSEIIDNNDSSNQTVIDAYNRYISEPNEDLRDFDFLAKMIVNSFQETQK